MHRGGIGSALGEVGPRIEGPRPYLVTSLTILLFVSCAPEKPCSTDTCSGGCCTPTGRCVTGSEPTQCGRLGLACEDCGTQASCTEKRCVESPIVPDAGTRPDGGGVCLESWKGVDRKSVV